MSNQVNEVIKERLAEEVEELGTLEVVSKLNSANVSIVSKFTGGEGFGADIGAFARNVLVEQMFEELAE
jgi:3-dehydroquinate synthase class II